MSTTRLLAPGLAEAGRRGRGRLLRLGLVRQPRRRGGRLARPAEEVLHPPVDERRALAAGHVRPQARPRQRRPVQADRHPRARHQGQRAPAQGRGVHGPHGHHPQPDTARRATTAGPPPCSAPATCRRGRSGTRPSARCCRRNSARSGSELPNFVSVAPIRVFNDGAFGPGFLGPNHAPLVVGERAGGAGQGNADRAPAGRGHDALGAGRQRSTPAPGSTCSGRCRATSWPATTTPRP